MARSSVYMGGGSSMKDTNRDHHAQPHAEQADAIESAQPKLESDPIANDGIDRRNFLSCMAWAGTGLLWTMAGGVPTSKLFAATRGAAGGETAHGSSGFSFVQISDSHI